MNFADLYRIANALDGPNVPFKALADAVVSYHPTVGDVERWACALNESVSLGHMTYETGRSSPYDEPYDVAVIRFSRDLNRCWRRMVCTKELMHVFDMSAAQTSDHGRFLKLMMELEARDTLLPGDSSQMILSERWAEWMAVLALCPQRLRDQLFPEYKASLDDDAIANRLKVPKAVIPSLMSDYYWRALERLTGEVAAPAVKKGHPA